MLTATLPARPSTPAAKRARLSEHASSRNIASQVASGNYSSFQALVDDVNLACELVVGRRRKEGSKRSQGSLPVVEVINRCQAFQKHLDNFMRRNPFRDELIVKTEPSDTEVGTGASPAPQGEQIALTLFGNAPRGRQMFSSLRIGDGEVDESLLPNGITVTKVAPTNSNNDRRTFGDVFYPRSTLPPLERPNKRPKPTTAMWIDPVEALAAERTERKGYLYKQQQSGHWINYGYPKPSETASRPNPFRNGLGDNDALFRSVYSSFAPAYESDGAMVPESVKGEVWWDRSGERQLRSFLSLLDEPAPEPDRPQLAPLDESTLEEAVSSFTAQPIEEAEDSNNPSVKEEDVDDLLEQISDLITTLNSYRQIRNFHSPAEQPGADAPDPATTPSAAEQETYETLRMSLFAMVSSLPPYAVAKLDGDQLSELNVSQALVVHNTDYAGTMEGDDYTQQQRQLAHINQMQGARTAAVPPAPSPAASRPGYQTPPAAAPYVPRGYGGARMLKQQPAAAATPYGARYTNSPQPYAGRPMAAAVPHSPYVPSPAPTPQPYTSGTMLQPFQRPTAAPARLAAASPAAAAAQAQRRVSAMPGFPAPVPATTPGGYYAPRPAAAGVGQYATSSPRPQSSLAMAGSQQQPQPARYFQSQGPQQQQQQPVPTTTATSTTAASMTGTPTATPTPSAGGAGVASYGRVSTTDQAALMNRSGRQQPVATAQPSPAPAPPQMPGQQLGQDQGQPQPQPARTTRTTRAGAAAGR